MKKLFNQQLLTCYLSKKKRQHADQVGWIKTKKCRKTNLKRPQEVWGVLEVGAHSEDFMNQVLNTNDSRLAQSVFNNLIAGDWNPLTIDLSKTPLVDQLPDWLQVRVTPCNVRLTDSQHVNGGLVQSHKHSIVDLKQSEQLEHLAHFRSHFVDTKNNHK